MILNDIINSDFETKDDLVVKLGEAVKEHEDLQRDFDEVRAERDKLFDENQSLKSKNIELLSMIPTMVEEKAEEVEEVEEDVTLDDIFEEDTERYEEGK